MPTSKLYVQNFYEPTLSSASVAASWDVTFTLSVTPTYTKWFITFSPSNSVQREIMYFDDVVWSTVYVKSENRWLGWTSAKAHTQWETVAMKDVAEIFNFFSNNISNAFYVEKKWWLNVNVWWWSVFYNQAYQSFSDTALTLTASTTNYIQYDYPTNTISVSLTDSYKTKAIVVTSSTTITSITYQVAKESYIDFTVTLNTALPVQTGKSRKVLKTNWTDADWGDKDDYVIDSWSANAYVVSIPDLTSYTAWLHFAFKATNANTGASTINCNSLWVKSIKKNSSADLIANDILAWQIVMLSYDWTNFQVVSTVPTPMTSVQIQETQYESTILPWDAIWQTPDWIYQIKTEVSTSTALWWANTYVWQCAISSWVYVLMYIVGWNATAVVATVSSADSVTYWTPINLWASASGSGWVALIDTNKVVFTFMDGSSTTSHTATSVIWTISGTTISLWTPVNTVHTSWGANISSISSVFKVRSTAYGYVVRMRSWDANGWIMQVNTISWTTITVWTTTNYGTFWTDIVGCYLADNTIAIAESASSNNAKVYIYAINPSTSAISTTYTWTSVAWSTPTNYICRYSDTEFVHTNSWSTACKLYTIPGGWSTLVETTLTANAASWYGVSAIYNWIFAVNTGSTLIIKQRDSVINTISSTPAYPVWATDSENTFYSNGRMVWFTWATLVPQIINLAKSFMIWIASNTTWKFIVGKNLASKTWLIKWYRYYLQSSWSLSNWYWSTTAVSQTTMYGRTVLTDTITIEI